MLFKPPLQVCNFTLRRFRVFLLHCCPILGRFKIVMFHFYLYFCYFVFSVCKGTANICIFQMFCPKIFVF